ncbi:hypothetical protein [Paenibacillus tianmuensis]|uniref:hypothetical protein n=1 Tax=Paenibacillus tianmuensis TaxID=624147 RepID=UPI001FE20204|nr:hypothetical protein [Paenibacillus tianmuensis]
MNYQKKAVSSVEKIRPDMIHTAIDRHMLPPIRAIGSIPPIAAADVSRIGRSALFFVFQRFGNQAMSSPFNSPAIQRMDYSTALTLSLCFN